MKTLVGSPPPEPEDDDGPVYVVTTLGPSSDTGFVVNALPDGTPTWSSSDTFTVQGPTITFEAY